MSWADNPLAVGGEGVQDLVGGLGPDERLGVPVPLVDPLTDIGLQLGDIAVGGPAQLAAGQLGEPALNKIQPGRAGGREVQLEAGMLQQPVLDRRGLVGGVVVQDQVQVQVLRHGGIDELEEPQELLVPVPPVVLGDHRAAGQVVGGEQAGGAVPDVVVRAALGRGGQHRQARGGAVQGLDLRPLVHGQNQGVLGRAHVEADDVADLADELRVRAQLPGLHDVGLEAESPPDPRDRRLRQASLGGHRPGRPVRVLPAAFLRQRARDQHLDLVVVDLPRRPRTRRVPQPVHPALHEPDPPLAD